EFLESADSGFPWSVSIEASLSPPALEKNVTVNGKHFSSIYVVRNAKLSGLAFCTAGADPSARAIAASFHNSSGVSSMNISATDRTKICSRIHEAQSTMKTDAFHAGLSASKDRAIDGELDALQFEHEVSAILSADAELHSIRSGRMGAGSIRGTTEQHGV